jgi:MoaA/NifB/PqqE/SkfB family radical SAM enzyme
MELHGDAGTRMIVVWRITQRCNLSCPFCSYDRTVPGERRNADLGAVLRFGKCLSAFQHERGEPVMVSWIGGEPFLWPELREVTATFVSDLRLRVSTTTNGTNLSSESVRRHIREHYSELTVSVDRLGGAHDALRGWKGGFESLRRHVTELAEAKRTTGKGPLLRVNTVLMRDNVGEFPALCDEVAGWGIDEISFNQLGGRDRPEFFPAHRLTVDDVASIAGSLGALRIRLAARGVRILGGPNYLRRFDASSSGIPLPVNDCSPGTRLLFIDERGLLSPCSYSVHDVGIPIESITSGSVLESLPGRFSSMLRLSQPAACRDCHGTQVWAKFH